jgi:cytochrome c biogenesis protein CcmG/thiol:disulfide interchange protein DsbE
MSDTVEPTEHTVDDNAEVVAPTGTPRRRLTKRWFVVIGLVAVLVAFAIHQGVSSPPNAGSNVLTGRSGAPAINFSLPSVTTSHGVLSLSTFRGRPLVINFWASWCVPCRTEMPLLEKAYRAEGGKVAFIGIDTNDTPAAARAFLGKVHVTYPTASDTKGSLAAKYGLFGLPTTIFISSTGKVLGRHIGQFYAKTLSAALSQAFGK